MSSDAPSSLIDIRRADAAYRGFPSFDAWLNGTQVDTSRWERYAKLLERRKELTPELLARARDVAKRAAAVDTGAIEGLYEVDRGFTFSVAMQMATWEAQVDAKGKRVRALIEAQLSAYDFVLDFATQAVPMAEAWIRALHEVMCKGQETYSVHTEVGIQEQSLPRGRYKVLPNHVLKSGGITHSYAPVDLVPAEMQRLTDELRSPEFSAAHPVQQAGYAHYAFVVIHPFADGNGRVARALASVYTYRSLSVPLVILSENRLDYYDALESADSGGYQAFTDFVLDRTLDSIQLVSETLKAAGVPTPAEAAARLKQVYLTNGGVTRAEVDGAAFRLFEAFMTELRRQVAALQTTELSIEATGVSESRISKEPDYRGPTTTGPRYTRVELKSAAPASADLSLKVVLEVPREADREGDLVLRSIETGDAFEARLTDAHPAIAGIVQLRLAVFVHGLLGRAISELSEKAATSMRQNGQ
jgi:Fic family protein